MKPEYYKNHSPFSNQRFGWLNEPWNICSPLSGGLLRRLMRTSSHNIYYNGTSSALNIKRRILPPSVTGILREDWRKKYIDKVFFTTSPLSAAKFAKKAVTKYGGEPMIFRVSPRGAVWHINTNEYVADSAVIVGVEKFKAA